MSRQTSCELCNPIALRSEQDDWWAMFRKHTINAQPDVDQAALDQAIAKFRAAQQGLSDAIGEFQETK